MGRDGYHHGDLRAALLEAAGRALEAGGPEAVSLRDLAKGLGVSTAAPYRHFADRRALLSDVAARGFAQLAEDYARVAATHPEPLAALRETGRVYLDLAFRQPGLFRLMFATDLLGPGASPGLLQAGGAAWDALYAAVAAVDPQADQAVLKRRTITGWSTLHGFVTLAHGSRLKDFMVEPLTQDDLVEAILDKTLITD
jgi:AcrR family transcriptional regulator